MDKKKEQFIQLATRVLSDEADKAEIDKLNVFLKEEEYKKWFDLLAKQWKLESEKLTRTKFSKVRGKALINKKLGEEGIANGSAKQKYLVQKSVWKYAAVITLLIISGMGMLFLNNTAPSQVAKPIAWKEKQTLAGQKLEITIGDGTSIFLNVASKLRYPAQFSDTLREVFLEGEAYFKVAHNPEKPFIVHTESIDTKVLGTSFNVNAYPEDSEISVSLIEGKVMVGKKGKQDNKVLEPMEQFLFEKENEKISVKPFDSTSIIGWKKNEFVFVGTPLIEVTQRLSRYYNVKFQFENKQLENYEIRADFHDLPLWTVLEVLSNVGNIKYETVSNNQKIEKVILRSK